MLNFIKTKKTYILALAVLFVFVSLSETTYSLFLKSDTTDEFNYNTGVLDLKFISNEQVELDNVFPIMDSEGSKLQPYLLTLKNTGTIPYLYDLKMVANDNSIDYRYIKFKVDNNLPHSLANTNGIIASNNIIYPGEEVTFKINIWLDYNTPNSELGKSFSAKIVTSGSSTYKTLDNSGANHPKLNYEMIPVYYNDYAKKWLIADKNNNDKDYMWYNYNNRMWANVVTVKETGKYIYDITRKHDIKIDKLTYNNGNYVANDNYLDLGLKHTNDLFSDVFRIKFDDLNNYNYIVSNNKLSYYYDNQTKKFIIKNGNNVVSSNTVSINENVWYIVGYTYDGNKILFYLNGQLIGAANVSLNLNNSNSYKLATNMDLNEFSKITFGNVLLYSRVLSLDEFKNNYSFSMNIVNDGLLAGFSNFIPMTLQEYYDNLTNGSIVNNDDVNAFYVWIPRFKYMIWNGMGEISIDSYNAYGKGIDIRFENRKNTSGVITCTTDKCFSDVNKTINLSNNDNGKYYTHPAFTKASEELTGFWVGKYEISSSNNTCNGDNLNNCISASFDIQIKDNNNVWRNNSLSNYYRAVSKLGENYHIVKNTEWGAITYLMYSNYGKCAANQCGKITPNETYISGNEINDSTTGNVYGVFDMAGGASEYTMGVIDNINILVKDIPISNDDYNLYTASSYILGDATKELLLEEGIWNNNTFNNNDDGNLIIRGGNITNDLVGIFAYDRVNDLPIEYVTTRVVYK